jgi:nitrogen fixation-related uncharacterized protein
VKKAFLITIGVGAVVSAAVIGYTIYWANKNFDNQEVYYRSKG